MELISAMINAESLKCMHLEISFSLMYFSFWLTAKEDKIFEVKFISFIGIYWEGFILL
jgi:hypothetical protein